MSNRVAQHDAYRAAMRGAPKRCNERQWPVVRVTVFLILLAFALATGYARAADCSTCPVRGVDNTDVPSVDTSNGQPVHYGSFFGTLPKSEYVFDLALAADMFTTLDIKNQKNVDGTWRLEEKNGLLGTHPSDARVISYIAGAALLHAAVTYEMVSNNVPMSFIHAWEYVSIGIETGFAVHNYTIGLRFAL